jgi:hypothetical protein
MKKIITLLFITSLGFQVLAQNEGRIGIFTGLNKTSLMNAEDKAFGDYLPTFKTNIGFDAAYHFTLGKLIATGIGTEISFTGAGQNYRGTYQDSTSYFAYARLKYLRMGMYIHLGTPLRQRIAVSYGGGLSYGFLTNYQDRYELVRYNNARKILDIKNSNVEITDTGVVKGNLAEALYKKTDLMFFSKLGIDIQAGENLLVSIYGRYDMGLNGVENLTKNTITTQTNPATSQIFNPYNMKVKYRTPVEINVARTDTKNTYFGIYLALRYRIWDKNKTEFWYHQRQLKNR